MHKGERIVGTHLRVGHHERPAAGTIDILAKIDAAINLAGLTFLLFEPGDDAALNGRVLEHCRKRGITVYLWYKLMTDNNIIPERGERCEDAFARRGTGETGIWRRINDSDETFLFGCPRNDHYNQLLLNRCRRMLKDYDGLFADYVGFPLPSLGVEGIFTCFCSSCLAKEPRLGEWLTRIHALRDQMASSTDDDLERWGTFRGQAEEFGITDFFTYRCNCITELAGRYSELAKEMGKPIGIDTLSPALHFVGGQHLSALGQIADWLKPRIYCHTGGPSSIPLEFYCIAMGMQSWAKRASHQAIMNFIGRSAGVGMPHNLHKLNHAYLPPSVAAEQIRKSVEGAGCPVYPGIECSLHPEYEYSLDADTIRSHLRSAAIAEGVVLAWNLLFIPDDFLKLVGE